jgi:PrcB C-terminal
MKNLSVTLFIATSFLFAACLYNVDTQNPTNRRAWEVFLQGKHCGIDKPRNMVIKSQKEFDALWEESQKGIDFGPFKPPVKPTVDFEKKWVIACFLGMVNTGGYSLEIQSIEVGPSSTLITILHKRPNLDCLTAQVIESPYLMATVDHFVPPEAEFKIITKDMACE